jgi:protein phosphatase
MLTLEQFGLFAVADGVGGAQAGDVASQMAMEMVGEAFLHYGDTVDPEEILRVSIERANEAIYQMAAELPQLSSMATTLAAIQVSGEIVTIAHVGDSRVYRLDPDGQLHRETNDHSMVEEEVRAGRMTPEQALNHPGRNVISRAVGAEPTVDVEIKTIIVDPGSSFLICTDGVTRHITDEELEHLLTTGMSPEMLCQQIKDICYERGAEDNLTAILVKQHVQTAPTDVSLAMDDEMETETVATERPLSYEQTQEQVVFDTEDAYSARAAESETFETIEDTPPEENDVQTCLLYTSPSPRDRG